MKRIFDFIVSLFALILLSPLIVLIAIAIKLTSGGPVLYWSERVGKYNKIFRMPKFRTMTLDTPLVPTRYLKNPKKYLTIVGSFLRKTSLDELPQLYSILKGDMTFVGPRPVLTNEKELLTLRNKEGINQFWPGMTGWAQVNGRDSVLIEEKVALEKEYMKKQSFFFDLYIFLKTIPKVLFKEDITH
ncbi:MAG: hypothetical protein ACD_16C00209G0027 [uncultured bacterium]|nr:MAG: hypothetical protein ACD_16C00209G0027 [uncultured bacterium]OFW68451.1 MAG: UDP-phosphate galactose phosphotransferase [Alphaproteobacteria bacterium GWC2_42_16]OFW72983.1 MAG: UDP-phosphate galactose phosphotransferase [Alphaproteobacteria bacterium GWA2_41_27]OFW81543.1 MAG: UDP-phosphate galactose phosphotransferase [Alphaproteobacteria bacterium RIFCSPHIGHO2_12_FULL_42_100]OFW86794.1 MAG: UDP-phosphate galactose phosphotransferase [Alphaproteobacteria bacterium RBG_16_42_14]OFW904